MCNIILKDMNYFWFLFEYCTKHVWLYTFLQEEEGSKEKQSGVYYSNISHAKKEL